MKITRKPILAAEYTYDQKVQMYEDIFRNVYKNLTDEQIHQRAVEQVDREEAFNRSREEERVKRANAIVTPEMERKLFDAAYEKRDISRIQKFIDLVNAGKITKDNYWDAITKYLTGRVMSDHVIHFWEAFCDYAYDTLYGKGVSATSRISGKCSVEATYNPNWRDEYPDQIEIMIPANDDTIRDEIIDYVWSTGKFGSTGSEFGKVTVMLTDATTADDVQDLIDFVYENGATVSQYYAKRLNDRFNTNFFASTGIGRRSITAAESYGWEVPDDRAREAYDFAIESGWWDEASLNEDIVRAISSDELAACLAFIFRNNDFQPWDDYLNGVESEDDEYEDEDDDE